MIDDLIAPIGDFLAGACHGTQVQAWSNKMGGEGGKLLAEALKAHPNYEQIAQNMFNGEAKVNISNKGLDAGDAWIMGAALEKNDTVTEVEASDCGMGTAGAKAFGDVLRVNKTLQHLNVSNNSFGKVQKGDQVKLKSSGKMKTVTRTDDDGEIKVEGGSDGVKPSEFEWESHVPAFCAGLAASSSLLSVSDSLWCSGRLLRPFCCVGEYIFFT